MSNLAPGLKPSSLDLLDVASIGVDGVASWLENVVEKCEENDGSELSSVAAAFVIFLKNCGVSLSVSVDGNDAPCGESVAAVEVSANDLPSGGPNPIPSSGEAMEENVDMQEDIVLDTDVDVCSPSLCSNCYQANFWPHLCQMMSIPWFVMNKLLFHVV